MGNVLLKQLQVRLLGVYLQMKPETPSCILVGLKLVGRVKHAGIAGIYHLDFHWKELFSRLDWCSDDASMVPWHAVLQCQICRFFFGALQMFCAVLLLQSVPSSHPSLLAFLS